MLSVFEPKDLVELEKLAEKNGITAKTLMENAGKALFHALMRHFPKRSFALFLGKGNNAGDGLCLARHLHQNGSPVKVFCLFAKEQMSPLAQEEYAAFLQAQGIIKTINSVQEIDISQEDVLIDALFGIGIKGKISSPIVEIIAFLNRAQSPVVAIDTPSGLNCSNGSIDPTCVKAQLTLTLGFLKMGFYLGVGFEMCGKIEVLPIGYEAFASQLPSPSFLQLTTDALLPRLPKIKRTRHKYERGEVICVAGSKEMPGAAMLTAIATLRAGAGMCTLFYPEEAESALAATHFEIIKKPISDLKTPALFQEMKRAKALVIGPGLGRDLNATQLIKHILQETVLPSVIDADALYFLSCFPNFTLKANAVLTPHKQEMLRLLGKEACDQTLFFTECQAYAKRKQCLLVLKGAPTFIFSPEAPVYISCFGDPGMATAGSGDVLSGIIGALLAQGLAPLDAALLGVALHGMAGEIAKKTSTSYAMIASDLIEALPKVYKKLSSLRGQPFQDS